MSLMSGGNLGFSGLLSGGGMGRRSTTFAPWSIGINFRATAGYVPDGPGEIYCVGDTYPTLRSGVTLGWEQAMTGLIRDRSKSYDRRLAGITYAPNAGPTKTFRLDLPAAGTYRIRLAMGDAISAQSTSTLTISDTGSVRISVAGVTSAATWFDATGVLRDATWPASNQSADVLFATTLLRLSLTPAAGNCVISHLYAERIA